MRDIIRLLPDSIANQIAAGEVVQRPASVVKELMENAVDAGATKISTIIKDAGKTQIKVVDNGCGMTETDARMSLERHATSKIQKTEDLFSLKTMGFRGEALASIAAVSQMELKTKPVGMDLGTVLDVEGSEVKNQKPEAVHVGTSVAVKNLFYNIPARRNFLKSPGVEMRHIVDEFQRVALSHPEMEFSLYQNDLETFNLPKGKLSQRIVHLFGKNYQEQLVAVNEETGDLRITGYVGKPDASKKTRGEQYLFVNNRFIKSNYLNHAILGAYQGLIGKDFFPFYTLFIQIDPAQIDVNIHPTKTEIKFEDERMIYGVLKASIKQALGAHNISPSIDFEFDVNFVKREGSSQKESIADKNYGQFRNIKPDSLEVDNLEALYKNIGVDSKDLIEQDPSEEIELTFPSLINQEGSKDEGMAGEGQSRISANTFLLHGMYIVSQIKSGMMMVDISRAHERILYEKFLENMESNPGLTQQSLFPSTVELQPADYALIQEMDSELKSLGFDFEEFGTNCIVINGVPADLSFSNEKALIEDLLDQFKLNSNELKIPRNEMIARSLAKRSGIKFGTDLTKQEMNSLIDSLFGCKNPNYTPDGLATFFILDLKKIEQFFN